MAVISSTCAGVGPSGAREVAGDEHEPLPVDVHDPQVAGSCPRRPPGRRRWDHASCAARAGSRAGTLAGTFELHVHAVVTVHCQRHRRRAHPHGQLRQRAGQVLDARPRVDPLRLADTGTWPPPRRSRHRRAGSREPRREPNVAPPPPDPRSRRAPRCTTIGVSCRRPSRSPGRKTPGPSPALGDLRGIGWRSRWGSGPAPPGPARPCPGRRRPWRCPRRRSPPPRHRPPPRRFDACSCGRGRGSRRRPRRAGSARRRPHGRPWSAAGPGS